MGDLLGSPRVAPLPFSLFLLFLFFPTRRFLPLKWLRFHLPLDELSAPLPLPLTAPPFSLLTCAFNRLVLGIELTFTLKSIFRPFPFGCDHTSTNAPDPIRTPQLSVLGRE